MYDPKNTLGLDPKNFKYVSSDEHSTTLQHKNGHTLTLAHNALSHQNRMALTALSKLSKQSETPLQTDESMHQNRNKMAEGGNIQNKDIAKHWYNTAYFGDKPNKSEEQEYNDLVARHHTGEWEKKKIPIEHIEGHHPGHGDSEEFIKDYVSKRKQGSEFPAVIAKEHPSKPGQYVTIDGMHRIKAAKQIGQSYIEAYIPKKKMAEGGKPSHQNKELYEKGMQSFKEKMPSPERQKQIDSRNREMHKDFHSSNIPMKKEYPNFDEGGKVPAPASDTSASDKEQRGRDMSQGAQNAGGFPSISTLVDRVKNAYAEGGEIEQMESQHGGEGHTCHACGGPVRHMYAEDGLVTKNPDIANVRNIVPEQPENSPFSASMANKRKEYNDIVQAHNVGLAASEDPRVYMEAVKQHQFGPNGEPPAELDPKSWNQMEDERIQAKDNNATQVADEALKTAQYNQAAQAAGVPLKPTQDIPGNQDTNQMQAPQQPQQQSQPQQPQQTQQPQQSDPFSLGNYNAGVSEMAGIQKEQLGHQIQQRQQLIDMYKSNYAELDKERHDHISDIQNGYIDPNKYWQDHSKVAAGIGMILGGFNPTNRPNAAIEFLQHQMDKSIESQKTNLDSKNNLLSANLRHFGDLHQATLATQAMMNDSLAQQMQQAALNAKNPLAKQAALGAYSSLMQQSMQFQMQLSMRQTMMHLAGGAGNSDTQGQAIAMMSAINPEMAKPYHDAYVPGVGMSKSLTPVPEGVRQQIASGQKLQNAAQDLLNYSRSHTNINPLSAEYQVGTQKARIVQQMVRDGMLGTVFRESEKPLLNDFVGANPAGAFKMLTTDPKLRTLLEGNQLQLNTLKQTYDLPTQGQQEQFKIYGGKKYKRGPNGEAIEVK